MTFPTLTLSRSQKWFLKNRRSTPTTTATIAIRRARRLRVFPSLVSILCDAGKEERRTAASATAGTATLVSDGGRAEERLEIAHQSQ